MDQYSEYDFPDAFNGKSGTASEPNVMPSDQPVQEHGFEEPMSSQEKFETDWWSLTKNEISGDVEVTVGKASCPLDNYVKDLGQNILYGCIRSIEDGGCNMIKIACERNNVLLDWNSFHASTPYALEHFKDTSSLTNFIEKFQECLMKGNVESHNEEAKECTPSSAAAEDAKLEDSNELLAQKTDKEIAKCFLGRYRISLAKMKPPSEERRVRELNAQHVADISQNLLGDSGRTLLLATPLVGLIDPQECPTIDSFDAQRINTYSVEVIDGNHNFHAHKQAFSVGGETHLLERDVFLYAGLSNEQCKRVGIMRNVTTSKCLQMSDWDYVSLIRREIKKEYSDEKMPGKDLKSREFWKRVYTMLGFSYERSVCDLKRPLMTLAKLPSDEFQIIETIFERKPSLKASAVAKALQGVKCKEKRTELLKSLLVSKAEYHKASLSAKGNSIHINVKDGVFHVVHGQQRLQGTTIKLSVGEKMTTLTPHKAEEIVNRSCKVCETQKGGLKRKGQVSSSIPKSSKRQSEQDKETKKTKVRKQLSKPSEEVNITKKKNEQEHQTAEKITNNMCTEGQSKPPLSNESDDFSSLCTGNSGESHFEFRDVQMLSTDDVARSLKNGQLLLCKPFKASDYDEDDPFIFKVLRSSLKSKKFGGLLMCGSLGSRYKDGDKIWKRSQCHIEVPISKIMAIVAWPQECPMPAALVNKIREIY